MNTNEIKTEMLDIKDLRTKKAKALREKFINLIEDFREMLDSSRYSNYYMLCLEYYDYSNDPSCSEDEELAMYYEDGKILIKNMEHVWDNDACGTILEEKGAHFSDKIFEDWKDTITTKISFNKFDRLVENIKKLVDDEKKHLEQLDEKLGISNV